MPIRKPIVILLESHLNYKVYANYARIFKHLELLGYDLQALEAPAGMSLEKFQAYYENEVAKARGYLETIVPILNSISIDKAWHKHLLSVDMRPECKRQFVRLQNLFGVTRDKVLDLRFRDLHDSLSCFIPNALQDGIVDTIARIRARELWLDELKSTTSRQLIPIDTDEDIFRHDLQMDKRNLIMASKLEQLFNQGHNVFLTIGRLHFPGLSQSLRSRNLLKHTLFFDMNSDDLDCGFLTRQTIIREQPNRNYGPNINPVWLNIFEATAGYNRATLEQLEGAKVTSINVNIPHIDVADIIAKQITINTIQYLAQSCDIPNEDVLFYKQPMTFYKMYRDSLEDCLLLPERPLQMDDITADLLWIFYQLFLFLLIRKIAALHKSSTDRNFLRPG